jgi:hypothetical protein
VDEVHSHVPHELRESANDLRAHMLRGSRKRLRSFGIGGVKPRAKMPLDCAQAMQARAKASAWRTRDA